VNSKLNNLATTEFTQYLHDQLATVEGSLNFTDSMHYKKFLLSRVQDPRLEYRLRADANGFTPDYYFLMTNDVNIKLFLAVITSADALGNFNETTTSAVPSSTLIFNVYQDESGVNFVQAYFNDLVVPLGGCSSADACQVTDFVNWLGSGI